jgi:hypothetical protein
VIYLIPHVRSHHSSHGNYPSERSGPAVVSKVVLPVGRCFSCKDKPAPCAWCVDLLARCPGCNLLKCNGSNVFCRE